MSQDNFDDFARIHQGAHSWCQCVAWWVPIWDGWQERSATENAELRKRLLSKGIFDGYLVDYEGELAGWVQTWRRDAFPKLASQFRLERDERAWMIGCLLFLPRFRGQGLSEVCLSSIICDLRDRGAASIDAFPKRQAKEVEELWNGAESTYAKLGFTMVRDDSVRPLYRLSF